MKMKGYYTNGAYFGYIPSLRKYLPFATETEYKEYLIERGEI